MNAFMTVVSGLPRSGTSMMMKILHAGGMELLVDHIRGPDEDNPRGYYEFERVKRLKEDPTWLPEAEDKAVKVISLLLYHLPADRRYKVIFMERRMGEILASQRHMLKRRGGDAGGPADRQMGEAFAKHLAQVRDWLARQEHMDVLHVSYNRIVSRPEVILRTIPPFLGRRMGVRQMIRAVDPTLYRRRGEGGGGA